MDFVMLDWKLGFIIILKERETRFEILAQNSVLT